MEKSYEKQKTSKAKKGAAAGVAVLALAGAYKLGSTNAVPEKVLPPTSEWPSTTVEAPNPGPSNPTTSTTKVRTPETTATTISAERKKLVKEYDEAVQSEVREPMLTGIQTLMNGSGNHPGVSVETKTSQFSEKGEQDVLIKRVFADGSMIELEAYDVKTGSNGQLDLESTRAVSLMQRGPVDSAPRNSDNSEGRKRVGSVYLDHQGFNGSGAYSINVTGLDGMPLSTNYSENFVDPHSLSQINMQTALTIERTAAQTTAQLLNNLFEQ